MSFYKIELLIEIPDEITKRWDSSCDETFGIGSKLDGMCRGLSDLLLDYKELSREEYDILSRHKVFDENGGI